MRDIVATIQPEQDELVRADLDDSICVQGAPGTGKTAVGLHRAAYLLYLHRERLRRSGVLIVGPNRAFLSLHRGGAAGARRGRGRAGHGGRLIARVPVRAVDDRRRRPRSSTTRGWPRCCAGRCAARHRHARPSRSWCPTGRTAGGSRRSALRRIVDEVRREGLPYARRPGAGPGPGGRRCCSGRPRRARGDSPSEAWLRRMGTVAAGDRVPRRGLAGGHPGGAGRSRCSPTRPCWPRRPTGCSPTTSRRALLWAKPPRTVEGGPVDAPPTRCCSTRRPG